jgi:hypothetical protein
MPGIGTIITVLLKALDLFLDWNKADAAKKKAFVDFLMVQAPDLVSSSRCYQAYKGMDAGLDAQIAALQKKA